MTAKYWGRGPQYWDISLVNSYLSHPLEMNCPSQVSPPPKENPTKTSREIPLPKPTDLCQWAIHYDGGYTLSDEDSDEHEDRDEYAINDEYADNDEYQDFYKDEDVQSSFDFKDRSTWTNWPSSEVSSRSIHDDMGKTLVTGSFSATSEDQLPISMDLIQKSLHTSPGSIIADSWAFAIMAGNVDVLRRYDPEDDRLRKVAQIEPYHLAAAYLDGGNTCCIMLRTLKAQLRKAYPLQLNYSDRNGHTILDSLMISVLRSHTNLTPTEVSPSFENLARFPGEDKDICGRWDSDSCVIRELFKSGNCRTPKTWKHLFCHTAVQTVLHWILSLKEYDLREPGLNTMSGLFRHRCTSCGLELKLGPLHTLVVVAFYLGDRGMRDETLFGAIACLVCLLAVGADTKLEADISVSHLFGESDADRCQHRPLNASDFAGHVPQRIVEKWSLSCQLGWKCFTLILEHAVNGPEIQSDDEISHGGSSESQLSEHDFRSSRVFQIYSNNSDAANRCKAYYMHADGYPCSGGTFGTLWAAIQTELLTYRRVSELDPWISPYFSIEALLSWLEGRTDSFLTPLVEDGMMAEYATCGWFTPRYGLRALFAVASQACSSYFMNMDIEDRATLLELVDEIYS